jgi:hypothetical protein
MKQISIHKNDIEKIRAIIVENNVHAFSLITENEDSGIGYCLYMQFDYEFPNGRIGTARLTITDENDW